MIDYDLEPTNLETGEQLLLSNSPKAMGTGM